MARGPDHNGAMRETVRIVDRHQHFLGFVKGGERFVYCRQCQRLVLIDQQPVEQPNPPVRADRETRERGIGPST